MLTLILSITERDDPDAVHLCLNSLEADSIGLCTCERLFIVSGKVSRPLRGRLHKMASRYIEMPKPITDVEAMEFVETGDIIYLDNFHEVEKGWIDRLVIEADRTGGVVRQGSATYYPRRRAAT
jgi:hypothetical protein